MPKKTKKQKILADQRRLSNQSPITQISPISPISPSPEYKITTMSASLPVKNLPVVDTVEKLAIQKDLRKTLILASLAILIELFLYWRIRL